MQRLIKKTSLSEMDPELVKEWHPTANGNLTPRKVDIDYPKAIWWICSQSHEWKATIGSRIKGNGCLVCKEQRSRNGPHDKADKPLRNVMAGNGKSNFKESKIVHESDFSDTYSGKETRKNGRFRSNGTAIIEIPATGHWFYAQMKNFSAGGMYFETEAAIKPKTTIKIQFEKPLFLSSQRKYTSTVKWCKLLDDDSRVFSSYGHGVKFV
jgi:Probable Zinc-ribbon domain/PilZ domain